MVVLEKLHLMLQSKDLVGQHYYQNNQKKLLKYYKKYGT
jgi:hypothetical protein